MGRAQDDGRQRGRRGRPPPRAPPRPAPVQVASPQRATSASRPRAARRPNEQRRPPARPRPARNRRPPALPRRPARSALLSDDDGRPLEQLGAKRAQLATHRLEARRPLAGPSPPSTRTRAARCARCAPGSGGPRPAPSLAPSMSPGMSAIDGGALPEVEHAEVGLDGGERVGGDLGMRPGQRREQRRLAGVGKTDQADVGEQLQRQREPELLAVQAASRRTAAPGGSSS